MYGETYVWVLYGKKNEPVQARHQYGFGGGGKICFG